jgi:hypothetical protein
MGSSQVELLALVKPDTRELELSLLRIPFVMHVSTIGKSGLTKSPNHAAKGRPSDFKPGACRQTRVCS